MIMLIIKLKYNKHKNNLYNTNKFLSNIGIYNYRRQLVSIIYNFKKEKIMKFQNTFSQSIPEFQFSLPNFLNQDGGPVNLKNIKFQTLVKFFNRFSNMRGVKKTSYAKQFIKLIFKYSRKPQFTYSIIRLMLPDDDRDRGNYGLKQKNLSKVIADSLNITKQDYLRLHHYKNPSFHKTGVGIGDFSLCTYDVVKSYCKENSSLTINELNLMLDQLAASSKNHINTFRKIFKIANAQQIKWIIRIILKDLKIGIKMDIVLNTFHKDANDYFNLTNSLIQTCKKFENPNVSLDDEIKMFFPIRPMLAGKKKMDFLKQNPFNVYYVETKYDGERLQAHKSNGQIKLFSRNCVDYTTLYSQLACFLQTQVLAEQCILDGEIVVIEKNTFKMAPFGMNKMVALNKQTDQYQLCYKIFDILWLKEDYQEINLMKYALKQRKQILTKIVNQIEGKIQLVKFDEVSQYDEILKKFSQSIDRNEEGIMLKNPNSIYAPKERAANWIKLKSDYIDGLTDTLDLIILGGYYGDSSARHGNSYHWIDQITSFLVGVLDKVDLKNPKKCFALPFAKVGTGYSFQELDIIRSKLKGFLVKNQQKYKPSFLENSWKSSQQDRPDCWISSLDKSMIFQVKAAQLTKSQSYPTGYTLRFPRVVKIRYDKDWHQAQTSKQLEELSSNISVSKHMKKNYQDSDSDGQKKPCKEEQQSEGTNKTKKKQKKQRNQKRNEVYEQFMGCNIQDQKLVSHLFSNFQFCVFQIDNKDYRKNDIEKEILLNDGIVVQNPMQSTQFIVTQSIDFKLRAYQTSKTKKYTFIKPKYIFNCIQANKILPLSPIYLTSLPQGNINHYKQNFDRFGDSYTNPLDIRQLDVILTQMKGQYPCNEQLIQCISLRHWRTGKKSICFGLSQIQKIKLKMSGDKIVDSFFDQPNSIVINGQLDQLTKKQINNYRKENKNVKLEQISDLISAKIL